MRLITSNDQPCAFLPNIMSYVNGELSLFFKIVLFIDAAEIWLIDNIVSQTFFDFVSDRPQNDEVKLASTKLKQV